MPIRADILTQLADALAELYYNQGSIETMAMTAGLNLARIAFYPRASTRGLSCSRRPKSTTAPWSSSARQNRKTGLRAITVGLPGLHRLGHCRPADGRTCACTAPAPAGTPAAGYVRRAYS
jgi:hypothetical protein